MSVKGYRRVAGGGACAFCQMLASRGGVYSARGADFQAHDGCSCSAEPIFRVGEAEPPDVVALREEWDRVTAGLSGQDALNAFRRHRERGAGVPTAAAKYHRNIAGLEDLASIVDTIRRVPGQIAGKRRLVGGETADVEVITLLDRRTIIRKRGKSFGDPDMIPEVIEQADAEQLAALVARELGATVARVYRTANDSVWMEQIRGAQAGAAGAQAVLPQDAPPPSETPEGNLLGILDIVGNNTDRNERNWLIDRAGRLVGIDHGALWTDVRFNEFFAKKGGRFDVRVPELPRHLGDSPFAAGVLRGRLLSVSDIGIIRRRLEGLRPDFVKLGRGSWLDWSLRILDIIPTGTGKGIYG